MMEHDSTREHRLIQHSHVQIVDVMRLGDVADQDSLMTVGSKQRVHTLQHLLHEIISSACKLLIVKPCVHEKRLENDNIIILYLVQNKSTDRESRCASSIVHEQEVRVSE